MSRITIDYGIDLGTTNSEVCVLNGIKPDSIRNNLNSAITSSAVYMNKRGEVIVGAKAKERLEKEKTTNDVYIEFKRRMGTDYKYHFASSGKTLSPKELSAEVLKCLKGDIQQQTGEIISAAVITVPAAFEQRQCAATSEAAALAGLVQSPLLQEPVAAALAYGFQAETQKEYWLVFDFGGGTFDAALIKAEDGTISVVNHGGDNFLGGADIDWAIFDQLVLPQLKENFNLDGFERGSDDWKTQLAILKRAIENAKIALSRADEAFLEDCLIKDADGDEIEIESFKITRNQVIDVAEPIIMRAVNICNDVLKAKSLQAKDVGKLILVGGPTLAPYFRDILRENLPVEIDHSVDPMTVVAQGAAIFARGQRLDSSLAPKASKNEFQIRLGYNPIGADVDPSVRGEVSGPDGVPLDGYVVEIIQKKSKWSSGRIPLKNGKLSTKLLAEKGYSNEYEIVLYDNTGTKQKIVPDALVYTIGASPTEQVLPVSLGVALSDNSTDTIFNKGDALPNKVNRTYKNTKTVKKGDADSKMVIPVVEGENPRADRNRRLASLEIPGNKIERDIPAGTDVEFTIVIDASRNVRVKTFIPVLDEEYEDKISYSARSPDVDQLLGDFSHEQERIEEILEKAQEHGLGEDEEDIRSKADEIESLLQSADDPDAASQAEVRLLELKVALDKHEDAVKFPEMLKEAEELYGRLEEHASEDGSDEIKKRISSWRASLDTVARTKDADKLRRIHDKMSAQNSELLREDPDFWRGFLAYLYSRREHMRDQQSADRLFEIGAKHMEEKNISGMASAVRQLLQLLPPEEAVAAQGAYGSTVQ